MFQRNFTMGIMPLSGSQTGIGIKRYVGSVQPVQSTDGNCKNCAPINPNMVKSIIRAISLMRGFVYMAI